MLGVLDAARPLAGLAYDGVCSSVCRRRITTRQLTVMERLAIFDHIPKTAGASLRMVVKANYSPTELLETYGAAFEPEWHRVWWLSFSERERERTRCIAGHTAAHLIPLLDRPFKAFCILRDPVERVVSLYHYLLQRNEDMTRRTPGRGEPTPGEIIHRNEWSLADVFERLSGKGTETGLWAFFNGQVRHIAGPYRSTAPLELSPGVSPQGEEYRDLAVETLSRHYVVGVQDRVEASVERFAEVFGWDQVFTAVENVTESRPMVDELDEALRVLILEHNRLDADLYAHFADAFDEEEPAAV